MTRVTRPADRRVITSSGDHERDDDHKQDDGTNGDQERHHAQDSGTLRMLHRMRALVAGIAALLVVVTTSCADQGNLMIRCPDAGGAIPVTDGHVTIDGVVMRVAADLSVPAAPDGGMTVAIDVRLPASPSATRPSVECVRARLAGQSVQWDATPSRVDEVGGGSSAHIRSTRGEGPQWRPDDLVDVTIWLRTATGRHVLTLSRQPIHRIE